MGHAVTAKEDEPLVLRTQLGMGETNKFVRAHVTTETGAVLAGSPFTLVHQLFGKYVFIDEANLKFPSGTVKEVHAQYIAYNDAGFTELYECSGFDMDIWKKDDSASTVVDDILDKVCQILNTISSINPGSELVACIDVIEICGIVEVDELCGVVEVFDLSGFIEDEDELFAWIESDDELIGILEDQDNV